MDEICGVFSLDKSVVTKYVQFGEVFNMLHAGASYLRIHQRGYGAVGVSKKYGKRSFARYPIFWGLSQIGSLPNPDPTDTAAWSKSDKLPKNVSVDQQHEAERAHLRTQAQEWAGLRVDPNAELFVFVGRWSVQKGVDLIADVFPSILEGNPNAQLICVGPVIDLHGKFAALKLQHLMDMYPDRVYSKPEFTALPPFIFSGAEFALIPSRDEPFGLVAVEFGRKGALGVGSRVGGLGSMPGWWFTIESVSTKHLIRQFRSTIKAAMSSSHEKRAEMRARSSLQRFPVAQWQQGLEKLQAGSIHVHQRVKHASKISQERGRLTPRLMSPLPSMPGSRLTTPAHTRPSSRMDVRHPSRANSPSPYISPSPTQSTTSVVATGGALAHIPSHISELDEREVHEVQDGHNQLPHSYSTQDLPHDHYASSTESSSIRPYSPMPSSYGHAGPADSAPTLLGSAKPSMLSMRSVIGEKEKSYRMQRVEPDFTDSEGVYIRQFDRMLDGLNGSTSIKKLCIEEFLTKSKKHWFSRFYDAKLGLKSAYTNIIEDDFTDNGSVSSSSCRSGTPNDEFELGADYSPPKGVRKLVQYRIRDWPLYSFFLALGQILAANSYQITLLSGEVGQAASKLYIIASIYLAASIIWWTMFRILPSRYVVSLPFMVYGIAFFILGMAPYAPSVGGRGWVQNVATGIYGLASGSGSLFFALNFGSEGGTATNTWVFRACVVQGTQQIYVTVLWLWGSHLSNVSASGQNPTGFASSPYVTAVTTPVAFLLAAIGVILFLGLPDFYRSKPGSMPSFYQSLTRRKIILWFFVVVIVQNYFLSAPYGRNWRFLWSSKLVPIWGIVILVFVFFILVWIIVFTIFHRLSIEHSWILSIFAIGLGAPRWAQMLWGVSGMGLYVPWAATPAVGALLSRALWLWLGILDSIQGVGFGMILLQTLTRFHIAFTLTAAQVVGSVATIVARATSPNRLGPGPVFPNLALSLDGLGNGVFWVALILQCLVCVGFFAFFRKEQLFKP